MDDLSMEVFEPRKIGQILLAQNPDRGHQVADGENVACADFDDPLVAALIPIRLSEFGVELDMPV